MITSNDSKAVKSISTNVVVILNDTRRELGQINNSIVELNAKSTNEIRNCWIDCNDNRCDYIEEFSINTMPDLNSKLFYLSAMNAILFLSVALSTLFLSSCG